MDYNKLVLFLVLGFCGALCGEIVKLYELRGKLHLKKFNQLFKFPLYWVITIAMCFASAFFAWAFNVDQVDPDAKIIKVVTSGLAANLIIKKLLESLNAKKSTELVNAVNPIEFGVKTSPLKDKIKVSDLFI